MFNVGRLYSLAHCRRRRHVNWEVKAYYIKTSIAHRVYVGRDHSSLSTMNHI